MNIMNDICHIIVFRFFITDMVLFIFRYLIYYLINTFLNNVIIIYK